MKYFRGKFFAHFFAKEHYGLGLTLANIPQDDPVVDEMICHADTLEIYFSASCFFFKAVQLTTERHPIDLMKWRSGHQLTKIL